MLTKGIRHSIVYFVHSLFFYHQRNFSSVYDDFELGIERNEKGHVISKSKGQQNFNYAYSLNRQIYLLKPLAYQKVVPSQSLDCRRERIGKNIF